MTDLARLQKALVNADAAGDTAAATAIAQEIRRVQAQAPQQAPQQEQPSGWANFGSGAVQGLQDAAVGLAQSASRLPSGINPVFANANQLAELLSGKEAPITAIADKVAAEGEQAFAASPAGQTFAGQGGRLAGNIAAAIPLGAGAIAPRGASLLQATIRGAPIGAAPAALQPVANAENFGQEKGLQAVMGAGFGAAGTALARGAGSLLENVLPSNMAARVVNAFQSKANTTDIAKEGEALAKRTGIPLSPGAVSGSRAQTAVENLARQSILSADKAFDADVRVAESALRYINGVMDRIKPGNVSTEGVGDQVQGAVRSAVEKIASSRDKMADKQYGALRKVLGDNPFVTYDKTKAALQSVLADYKDVGGADAQRITTQAAELLETLNKKPGFTIDEAIKTRSYYGKAARGKANLFADLSPDLQRGISKRLFGALSDDLEASAARLDANPAAQGQMGVGEMFRQANANYRRHNKLLEAVEKGPLKRLLGDQVNVDDFMTVNALPPEQVVKRLNGMAPSELVQVRKLMETTAPDAWASYKRLIVQDAVDAAAMAPASAGVKTLPLNASSFIRAIGGDKPDKIARLRSVFSDQEMRELDDGLQALRRVGDRFGFNFSGTAPAQQALTMFDRLKGGTAAALASTGGEAMGLRNVANLMANADGRRAVIQLSRLPEGSRQAAGLAGYVSALLAGQQATRPDEQPAGGQ